MSANERSVSHHMLTARGILMTVKMRVCHISQPATHEILLIRPRLLIIATVYVGESLEIRELFMALSIHSDTYTVLRVQNEYFSSKICM